MKKVLSFLTAVCLVLSSVSFAAFADDSSADVQYNDGDVVASWDFEDGEVPKNFVPWGRATTVEGHKITTTLTTKADNITDNKYLEAEVKSENNSSVNNRYGVVSIPVPEEAKRSSDGAFTFEARVKFAAGNDGERNPQYYMGLYPREKDIENASYVSLTSDMKGSPRIECVDSTTFKTMSEYDDKDSNGNATAQHRMIPAKKTYGKSFDGESNRFFYPAQWCTYRFVARKNADNQYYADVYVNGRLWYSVGTKNNVMNDAQKNGQSDLKFFNFMVWMLGNETGKTNGCMGGKIYVDNAKFMYGATEPNVYDMTAQDEINKVAAKGAFEMGVLDFDSNTTATKAGVDMTNNDQPQGSVGLGAYKVSDSGSTKAQIKKSGFGKTEDDVYMYRQGGFIDTAAQVKKGLTELRSGDTIEISADVKFDSNSSAFQIKTNTSSVDTNIGTTSQQDDRLGFHFAPTFWSYGAYGSIENDSGSTFLANNSNPSQCYSITHSYSHPFPANKWIKLRLFITNDGDNNLPKLSAYADGIELVKNEPTKLWYKQASVNATKSASEVEDSERIKGGDLLSGLENVRFFANGVAYDNIKITNYLGVTPDIMTETTSVPYILNAAINADNGDYVASKGTVYVGEKTLAEVKEKFGLDTDDAIKNYVVVDGDGKVVDKSAYGETKAGGNYVVVTMTNDETYYASLFKNEVSQNITEATASDDTTKFGDFVLTNLTASGVTADAGRGADNKAVKLSATESANGEAKYSFNSYDAGVIEFSFLGDENTNFNFGYDVDYLFERECHKGNLNASNKVVQPTEYRSHFDIIQINGNKVYGTKNPNKAMEELGTYKNGEWTKVRINLGKASKPAYASVNGGEVKMLDNGPSVQINVVKDLKFTVTKGTSLTLDDVRVTKGTYAKDVAPKIVDNEAGDIKVLDGKLFLDIDSYDALEDVEAEDFATLPEGLSVTEISEKNTAVVANNGIYSYYLYGVYSFSGIRTNDETNVPEKVELIGKTAEQAGEAKLFAAVYEGTKLVSVKTTDLTLAADGLGVLCADLNGYTAPEVKTGQTLKYFVWNTTNLAPLGILTVE